MSSSIKLDQHKPQEFNAGHYKARFPCDPKQASLSNIFHETIHDKPSIFLQKPLKIVDPKQVKTIAASDKKIPVKEYSYRIMQSIKNNYYDFLNSVILKNGLGRPTAKHLFDKFFDNLTLLITHLDVKNLNKYVLRYTQELDELDEDTLVIHKLSSLITRDLISFGFQKPEKGVIFWSGQYAKEKAMAQIDGTTDEQVLLMQALWGINSLIKDEEKRINPSLCSPEDDHYIYTKLMVAFSSILSEYSVNSEATYYLGYSDSSMNVSSAFWKGELPSLMKIAKKVNLIYLKDGQWFGPYDLKDPKNQSTLNGLNIHRIDYKDPKAPFASATKKLTFGDMRRIFNKWKRFALTPEPNDLVKGGQKKVSFAPIINIIPEQRLAKTKSPNFWYTGPKKSTDDLYPPQVVVPIKYSHDLFPLTSTRLESSPSYPGRKGKALLETYPSVEEPVPKIKPINIE